MINGNLDSIGNLRGKEKIGKTGKIGLYGK